MTRRKKEKYPNLKKDLNLKGRRDYIDTHYVDGVYDEKGNKVIRELNEEEKKWLDEFYRCNVNASFTEKTDIFTELDEQKRREVKVDLRTIKKEIEKIQKEINEHHISINELVEKKALLEDDYDKLYSKDIKKQIYDENNSRNRCLYNQAKKRGKLIKINRRTYEDIGLGYLEDFEQANEPQED